jgi:hypothetical protein
MKEPGLIEKQFLGYVQMVYRGGPLAMNQSQLQQLRQAFYAGATMYQGLLLGNLSPDEGVTPQDEAAMQRLFNQYAEELEAFAESVVSGMPPAQGSA